MGRRWRREERAGGLDGGTLRCSGGGCGGGVLDEPEHVDVARLVGLGERAGQLGHEGGRGRRVEGVGDEVLHLRGDGGGGFCALAGRWERRRVVSGWAVWGLVGRCGGALRLVGRRRLLLIWLVHWFRFRLLSWLLVDLFEWNAEAEAKLERTRLLRLLPLWRLRSRLLRPMLLQPMARTLAHTDWFPPVPYGRVLLAHVHQAQSIRQRIQTGPLLTNRRYRHMSTAPLGPRARPRRVARLLLVLPAVQALVGRVVFRRGVEELACGRARAERPPAGTPGGGDAAAGGLRVLGVGAGEKRLGRVGDEWHGAWLAGAHSGCVCVCACVPLGG